MNRRSLLKTALALLGLPFAGSTAAADATEEYHLFDWYIPCTTDPQHKDTLTWGYHNVVYLDGVQFPFGCKRFLTGPNGWIEVDRKDQDGNFVFTPCSDDIISDKLWGHVTYVDTRRGV